MNNIIITSLFIISMLFGCSQGHEEHGHGHDDHDDKGHNENAVSLTKLQMETIELELVQLEERNMSVGIEVTGQLELPPQDKADISPILGGIVKSVLVIEGDAVRKGQVLAILEHPDFIQYQQEYVAGINNLRFLEKEYERQKKLYDEKVGSGRDFQRITTEYQVSKSKVASLKEKLRLIGLNTSAIEKGKIYSSVNLVSPMKGSVSLVKTNIGSYIEPMSKAFEVVNVDQLHADFRVYEQDVNKIAVGQKIHFTTTALPNENFEGKIHAISPVFEENPKAVHIHADIIDNKRDLIPGMYVKGKIITEDLNVAVLPEQAIVQNGDKTFVFLKINEASTGESKGTMIFESREVITGVSYAGYTEVKLLNPIDQDSQIAGKGAYFLLAEKNKSEAEHNH